MADKYNGIPADRYRGQIYDGPESFTDVKYFREGPRGKADLFQDVSKNYVKNPTPQAAYAISKAAKNTPSGTVEDEVAAIKKDLRSGQKEYFDSLNERIVKAGREADNEMRREGSRMHPPIEGNKKGGKITAKKMASGGKVSSASKRADGIATKGKTKGRIV